MPAFEANQGRVVDWAVSEETSLIEEACAVVEARCVVAGKTAQAS